jgi:DME family drug/metabolite transporter
VGFAAAALYVAARAALLRSPIGICVPPRALLFLATYGILGYALFTIVFLHALQLTPVSIAVALLYTAPAFVLVMSAVLWRERVGRGRLLALGMVLGGVVLVTGAADALLRGGTALPAPALAAGIAAGLTYASYTMFSRVASIRYGATPALFWSFAFAAAAFALLAPPHAPFVRAPEHTGTLIALGIVPTLLPYALYLAALRELRASTAAMLAAIEPVVAALLAALLLAERLEVMQGAGIALVVAAAVLLARGVAAGAEER